MSGRDGEVAGEGSAVGTAPGCGPGNRHFSTLDPCFHVALKGEMGADVGFQIAKSYCKCLYRLYDTKLSNGRNCCEELQCTIVTVYFGKCMFLTHSCVAFLDSKFFLNVPYYLNL